MSRAATAQWQRSDSAATVATSAARQNKSFSEACSVCKQKVNNKKNECYPETLKKQTQKQQQLLQLQRQQRRQRWQTLSHNLITFWIHLSLSLSYCRLHPSICTFLCYTM